MEYLLYVSILLNSMMPPTIPPFASKLEPPNPTPMYKFLCPVLPIDSLPSDRSKVLCHPSNVAHDITHVHVDI